MKLFNDAFIYLLKQYLILFWFLFDCFNQISLCFYTVYSYSFLIILFNISHSKHNTDDRRIKTVKRMTVCSMSMNGLWRQ